MLYYNVVVFIFQLFPYFFTSHLIFCVIDPKHPLWPADDWVPEEGEYQLVSILFSIIHKPYMTTL